MTATDCQHQSLSHQLVITEIPHETKYGRVLDFSVVCHYGAYARRHACGAWEPCSCNQDFAESYAYYDSKGVELSLEDWVNGMPDQFQIGRYVVEPHHHCPDTGLLHHTHEDQIFTATGDCYAKVALADNTDTMAHLRMTAFGLEPGVYPLEFEVKGEDGIEFTIGGKL